MTTSEKADWDHREALREARVAAFFARQQGELSRGEAAGRKVCEESLRTKSKQLVLEFEI